MNAEYKDFIAIYRDVYPDGYCQHLINEFERLVESGAGLNRQRGEGANRHNKDDVYIELNLGSRPLKEFNGAPTTNLFFQGLQECYDAYIENFSILKDAKINAHAMKMQRTPPGGGYHLWHCEQNGGVQAERVLVYMLYLNTLSSDQAGETEFLYQQRRLQPVENSMVIWPAAFTHTHRGNVVHGEKYKYIVTGWFYYD